MSASRNGSCRSSSDGDEESARASSGDRQARGCTAAAPSPATRRAPAAERRGRLRRRRRSIPRSLDLSLRVSLMPTFPIARNFWYRASSRVGRSPSPRPPPARGSSAVSSSAAASSWFVCAPPTGSGDDLVDDAERQQVRRRQLQRLGRFDLALRVAPQDRRAPFGRDHAVDRELVHQDAIADRDARARRRCRLRRARRR